VSEVRSRESWRPARPGCPACSGVVNRVQHGTQQWTVEWNGPCEKSAPKAQDHSYTSRCAFGVPQQITVLLVGGHRDDTTGVSTSRDRRWGAMVQWCNVLLVPFGPDILRLLIFRPPDPGRVLPFKTAPCPPEVPRPLPASATSPFEVLWCRSGSRRSSRQSTFPYTQSSTSARHRSDWSPAPGCSGQSRSRSL